MTQTFKQLNIIDWPNQSPNFIHSNELWQAWHNFTKDDDFVY